MTFLERTGERFSSILVKEVRQALRGRYFAIAFWFTLVLALVLVLYGASQANLDSEESTAGREVFYYIFISLAIACHGLIPFAAFQSMGNEWDEGTFDLLVLSNLTPRQIVLGKLWSASTQAMLVYSALLPFFGVAFLCGGIDILSVFVMLGFSTLLTLASIAFALGVSSLARTRIARMILGLIVLACLTATTWISVLMGWRMVISPEFLREREFFTAATTFVLFLSSVAVVALGIASARLAHAEENRSTPLRIITFAVTVSVLLTLALTFAALPWSGWIAVWVTFLVGFYLYVNALYILTEAEPLPRRTRSRISKSPWRALLTAPFLPGGGRGALYLMLLGLCSGACIALLQSMLAPTGFTGSLLAGWLVIFGYIAFLCAIPGVFVSSRVKDISRRNVARLALVGAFVGFIVCPLLIGVSIRSRSFLDGNNIFNPVWAFDRAIRQRDEYVITAAVITLTIAALLNLSRMNAGVREVLDASRDRRLREEKTLTGATVAEAGA